MPYSLGRCFALYGSASGSSLSSHPTHAQPVLASFGLAAALVAEPEPDEALVSGPRLADPTVRGSKTGLVAPFLSFGLLSGALRVDGGSEIANAAAGFALGRVL